MAKWTCSKHVIEYSGPECPLCKEAHEKARKTNSKLWGSPYFTKKNLIRVISDDVDASDADADSDV